jgi:anti-anti-sigma factor
VNGDSRIRIDVRQLEDRVVLELHGELDLVGAPVLGTKIGRAELDERRILVLDLEDLEFIDSAGLRVILAANERARERGDEFAVTPGSAQVKRLLAIAGVSEHLPTIASAEAAVVPDQGSPQAP